MRRILLLLSITFLISACDFSLLYDFSPNETFVSFRQNGIDLTFYPPEDWVFRPLELGGYVLANDDEYLDAVFTEFTIAEGQVSVSIAPSLLDTGAIDMQRDILQRLTEVELVNPEIIEVSGYNTEVYQGTRVFNEFEHDYLIAIINVDGKFINFMAFYIGDFEATIEELLTRIEIN